ncbi:hypothetical protein ACIGCH_06975 [Pseudomonas helleri]|nr:hypothetical protein [Pseudomonas helleri]MQU26775.1 hypothetical protein [Pseudomonas helleri]
MHELRSLYLDAEISAVTFDVFGFSRGAAAARHFVNEVTSGYQGYWRELMDRSQLKFSAGLRLIPMFIWVLSACLILLLQ